MDIENEKIDEFIKNLNNYTCPLCSSKNWIIGNKVFFLLEYDKKTVNFAGATYPVIPITCPKCGNTMLINVIIPRLLDINTNVKKHTEKDKNKVDSGNDEKSER